MDSVALYFGILTAKSDVLSKRDTLDIFIVILIYTLSLSGTIVRSRASSFQCSDMHVSHSYENVL